MARKKNKLDIRYFNELKETGLTVPRDDEGNTLTGFMVGKKYDFTSSESDEVITGLCSQNNPIAFVMPISNR